MLDEEAGRVIPGAPNPECDKIAGYDRKD